MSERRQVEQKSEPLAGDPFAGDNPYTVLGVDRESDIAGIRAAYRAKLRQTENERERQLLHDAFETLTRPRSRLLRDLFAPRESRRHEQIMLRYGAVRFELEPHDVSSLLMHASDLEWGGAASQLEVPRVPKVVFESMLPSPPRGDELVVPDRKK
ncbi:MAG: hypothetical protein HYU52_09010 [Acidobacteria bacterium]|nr:hypothetical protein [Acidobacteriota bacterium]